MCKNDTLLLQSGTLNDDALGEAVRSAWAEVTEAVSKRDVRNVVWAKAKETADNLEWEMDELDRAIGTAAVELHKVADAAGVSIEVDGWRVGKGERERSPDYWVPSSRCW